MTDFRVGATVTDVALPELIPGIFPPNLSKSRVRLSRVDSRRKKPYLSSLSAGRRQSPDGSRGGAEDNESYVAAQHVVHSDISNM